MNSLVYWVSNPIWVGGTLGITALATIEEFFNQGNSLPGPKILSGATLLDVVFVLAFIWFTVGAAIISFSVGKWVPTIGAFMRSLLLGFFTISVVIYAIKNGIHDTFGGSAFLPSYAIFIAAVPVLIFNYVGFELPSAAGEEMKNPQRDVPLGVARSAVGTVLLYGLPILAILLLLPKGQVTGLTGFLAAIKSVFTVVRRPLRGERDASADRRRPGARLRDRDRVRAGTADQRDYVDHGRGPGAGHGRTRRRGTQVPWPVLGPVRYADYREFLLWA